MIDPLAEIVTLLQPSARFSKTVLGAGSWRLVRSDAGQPFYWLVLEGGCRIAVDGREPVAAQSGDFMLIPAVHEFAVSSLEPPPEGSVVSPVALGDGRFRLGRQEGPADLRMLVGHCRFASPDADLLVSLLPQWVHVRNQSRLEWLVRFVGEESRAQRPARDEVLSRLLEVMFIEALRSTDETTASPGLVNALADTRLVQAVRAMHAHPSRPWTVAALAKEAALSRSAFFEKFRRTVGVAPMAYLLAWRMALAKQLLRQGERRIADIAERVGYRSASTFSVAFTRYAGQPPSHYARDQA